MKLQISESAAGALAVLAVVARIVGGVLIDMPDLLNAGWLSILIGALLALPLMLAISCIRTLQHNRPAPIPPALCIVFFLIAIWDAAYVASMIADSAGYLALNSTASIYLLIPQFVLCLGCLLLNGDALGASAVIWNKFLPALLLIVILLQSRSYEPRWLTPLFGPGLTSLLSGSVRIAGWFCLPAALFLIARPDVEGSPGHLSPLKTLVLCAAFSTLIALAFSMMTPLLPNQNLHSRTFRFDALLANGRSGRALQLPTIALWYPSQFYALLFDVFTSAVMLQKMLPKWPHSACIWLSLVCTALLAASHYSGQAFVAAAAGWLFAALGTAVASYMLCILHFKGDKRHA